MIDLRLWAGLCDYAEVPHRPPKKIKKPVSGADADRRAAELAEQRRREMAARSAISRFQNRSSERK